MAKKSIKNYILEDNDLDIFGGEDDYWSTHTLIASPKAGLLL